MDLWKAEFKTRQEVFEWVGTSRFFKPGTFRSNGEGFRKVKPERKMYAEFIEWATRQAAATGNEKPKKSVDVYREEALIYFKKKEVFDALVRERVQRLELKQVFAGHKVRDWANLGEYWKGVKLVMDAVRERCGGDEGVWKIYEKDGEEGVKKIVLQVKDQVLMTTDDGKHLQPPVDAQS